MKWIQKFFDLYLRKYLPPKKISVNGIEVYGGTIFDRTLQNMEGYEQELIDELESALLAEDHVCIVGGGLGITTVIAARTAERITTYEAGRVNARNIQRTVDYHDLDNVEVVPKPVGNPISIWGRESASNDVISPESLPDCDVLELDCEGSELEILNYLTIDPRTIVVESHGMLGSTSDEITSTLDSLGYGIQSTTAEVAEDDITIIRATRKRQDNK